MKINSDFSLNQLQIKQNNLIEAENKFKGLLAKKIDKSGEGNDKIAEDEELRKVSQDFEAIFVNMMFKQMRSSVFKSGLLDGGMSREIFEDMYYNQISKSAAENNELGIAEMIYQQLSNKS
ncbi:hypothetical protein U472_14985 [Orenia metallireducens]|jgi:flagellar protein FlgJ|uniref:Flagellar protein FlgJ N-terminal domain-containing protein n=1 Tax=Orenia metallireducens TaxID=1413210 RepID=A0A1C0A659_9FIRM|nr:rod-binding protein [Orenia metallireducens]OCL25632.1 hypothetical protein U472_14985 [Orenia metallireducens]